MYDTFKAHLLNKRLSGTYLLHQHLQDYTNQNNTAQIFKSITALYEEFKRKNCDKAFAPQFTFTQDDPVNRPDKVRLVIEAPDRFEDRFVGCLDLLFVVDPETKVKILATKASVTQFTCNNLITLRTMLKEPTKRAAVAKLESTQRGMFDACLDQYERIFGSNKAENITFHFEMTDERLAITAMRHSESLGGFSAYY